MTYAEKFAQKELFRAYSPINAPVGVHVGIVPAEHEDYEPEDTGRYIMLNSALSPVRGMPTYESPQDLDRVFEVMNELMIEDDDMSIWKAAPRARDRAQWEIDAEAAGMSVEDYIAQKEAEEAEAEAEREKARELREKTRALREKGVKVRTRKGETEIALSGDMLEAFKAFVARNPEGGPLSEFLTTGDLTEAQES